MFDISDKTMQNKQTVTYESPRHHFVKIPSLFLVSQEDLIIDRAAANGIYARDC